ncbi:MAG TPA: ABC transporter permease [Nevskia sp.]|nr:ABC transporter permease [Nevskia sp.]
MKYLPLLWAALWRKKARTIFTIVGIALTFLLFGMGKGVDSAFNHAVDNANVNRLIVTSKIALTESLPYSYLNQIASVPGVAHVAHATWFGPYYQDPKNFVFSFPVDPELDQPVFPERELPKEQYEAFLHTRSGAIVGGQLAEKYGWKIGDRVPLHSTIWTRGDRSSDWTFDVVGIYHVPKDPSQESMFLFNYSYFDEARSFGKGTVGWYTVMVRDPAQSAQVAAAIDKLFANSANETKTETEKEFQQAFIKQIADINYIVDRILFAVFFALIFATGTTMLQSVRERVPELAVMKTLGFSDTGVLSLVLAESLLLWIFSAAAGLGLAALIFPALKDVLGLVRLPPEVLAAGAALTVLLSLVTGLLPAWRAKRLDIIEALRS